MGEPAKGDTLLIGNKAYTITAVGSEAPHTLAELSHCTLCFKGGEVPERPGCIMLEGDDKLTAMTYKSVLPSKYIDCAMCKMKSYFTHMQFYIILE